MDSVSVLKSVDSINLLNLLFGLLATIAAILAIVVILRARQLSRSSLKLHIGFLFDKNDLPKKYRNQRKRTLFFGSVEKNPEHVILALPYIIENTSKLPINDLRVEFVYPTECLLDNAIFVDRKTQEALVLKVTDVKTREVLRIGDVAYINYNIPIVRPYEKLISVEFLKIGKKIVKELAEGLLVPADMDTLNNRFSPMSKFLGAQVIRIGVWSSNCPPAVEEVYIFWFNASSMEDLTNSFREFGNGIWDNLRPKPGLYFKTRWQQRMKTIETSELIIPAFGVSANSIEKSLSPEIVTKSERAIGWLEVPPWGYFGRSFNLKEYLGLFKVIETNH